MNQTHSFTKYSPTTNVASIVLPSGEVWQIDGVTSASLHRLFIIAQSPDVRIHKLPNGDVALHHEGWNLFRTNSTITMLPDSLFGCADYRWNHILSGCYEGCLKSKEMLEH
jgi:hypothetical protein